MRFILAAAFALTASAATAQSCGGTFSSFLSSLKSEAARKGHSAATIDRFFTSVRLDPSVVQADRRQGVFQKDFLDFSRTVISAGRLQNGARNSQRFDTTFDRIESAYGVPRGVLLAFWALETDYGAVQGDFNTLNALVTLAHDCRRPELFRPQIFAAIELYENGDFDPARTTGAWAGEIGMVQMLPEDLLTNGRDGDGDGKVSIKTSAPDALTSAASMLQDLGWQPNQPWLVEVTVPQNLDWSQTGLTHTKSARDWVSLGVRARQGSLDNSLPASVLLPMGRNGPAFLAYPNFNVYFEWNQSFVYVTSAAYMATRISGADRYNAGNPPRGLSGQEMQQLQQKLQNRGYDVGGVDGILGARTRAAVQAEQQRLGLPADAWPTRELLNSL
jgi:lytic murein transglycosylase